MKRFWEHATAVATSGGYEIALDGRPMRLPSGVTLIVGRPHLAMAIAEEWQTAGGAKGGEMSFRDTPLTRLAGTAQERIAPAPTPTADAIARYGETDLLCYRADAPPELVRRQMEGWQPWLDWAAQRYDAPLRVTTGIQALKQHHDSISALRAAVIGLDSDILAALGIAVPALGSLILGLALEQGALDADAAFRLSALDELFQVDQWGEDTEAATRRQNVLADVALAARYIQLAKQGA
jgi:chaperone required for assembly of F1-ATPase